MKSLLSAILCCLMVSGGNPFNQSKGYTIVGSIENLPANAVFIRVMKRSIEDNHVYYPKIDSAKVVNGKFVLNKDTVLADPAWASSISYIDTITKKEVGLRFSNPFRAGEHRNFILENAQISISGDARGKTGLEIKGSKETDFNFKYGLISPIYAYQMDPIIDSLKKAGNTVELAKAIEKRKTLENQYRADLRKIIADNPSTHQSLVNLYQNSTIFTASELEELLQLMDPALLKTDYGTKMLTYIARNKVLLVGMPFPDFSYNDITLKKINLNDIKGKKATVIVFWASWCGPCRQEIPQLKKLYAKYHAQGINMVSISIDHNINEWKKALTIEKMPWVNVSNLPGDHAEISTKYNVKSIPSIFLLDKDGKILLADIDFPELEEGIKKLAN